MKVLIVDPLSFVGHVNYNYGIIDALRQEYEYDVVCNEKLQEKLVEKGIPTERFVWTFPERWNLCSLSEVYNKIIYHLLYRYYFLKVILKVFFLKKKYDFILFTSVEIVTFCFLSWLFDEKCAIVDHGIGIILEKWYYKYSWKFCNNEIKIVVLEEFIKKRIKKVLPSKQIFVLHHPLPVMEINQISFKNDNVLIFAPSSSNSDYFLKKMIGDSIPNNVYVYAKSQSFEFHSANIEITNGYISNEEYYKKLNESQFILLPYKASYNYRISAILFEALVLNKIILLLANNTLSYYKEMFPNNIVLFSENDSLENVIKESLAAYVKPFPFPNLVSYEKSFLSMQLTKLLE